MTDPITQIAVLVRKGILKRHDGPYEMHYPMRRNAFMKLVKKRISELEGKSKHKKKKRR